MEFDHPATSISRQFRGLSELPSDLTEYHNLGAKARFILRRKNLLDFILAQPAPRYEQLAAIIGVSDLNKVEIAFKQVRDDLETQVNFLRTQINAEKSKLDELIGHTSHSDEKILQALNNKLANLQQPALLNLEEAEQRKLKAVSCSRSPEEIQRAVDIQNFLKLAGGLSENIVFFAKHRILWIAVEELQADVIQVRELLFREALAASRKVLTQYSDMDYCPICLRPADRLLLIESIERRVAQAQSIEAKSNEIRVLRDNLAVSIQSQFTQFNQLVDQARVSKIPWDIPQIEPYFRLLTALTENLQSEPVEMRLPSLDKLVVDAAIKSAEKYLLELIAILIAEKSKLEPTEQDQIAVSMIDLLTRVVDNSTILNDLRPKLIAKEAAYREMDAIYGCFISTKRDEIKKIYSDLEGDIKRYFKLLHENEGYQEIKLDVDDSKRASTEIKMDFHDRLREDPRAFNSEGHLDSLGLCVFLAFVKRFNMGFPIIVLDDVVSSINSGHRQRICKLLFEEFSGTQIFITTHDYVWFEELCSHQRTSKKEHEFKNFQILYWSLEDGPRLDKYKPRWERIQEKLGSGDKDGAAGDIRKELEAFLFEAVISLVTPIPIKRDGKYTIADLHDPLVARVKKLVPEIHKDNLAIFKDLQNDGIFGNLLVHNNPRAESVGLEEVHRFADAVKKFEGLFKCDNCKQIVTFYRDAKIIRCRCKEKGILWTVKE